ncbi:hypothetical protein CONPUDRAFT_157775 [Coniophora puteana RWD-64-598 SS2]|uniref:Uncharacterized protein n=1 Tax=Coniophora puteana (strain RWD-64-598) TaxID=741705 RepID=A0A5M3MCL9_CONPW|nr:uncharacterized protein CONPUDRAFT_157775 [Coniophora puteana RWD-64-598 SS2]EIW76590.1 hypothetical protein CONPUDRAFT_157775 [Coniophora puteana RWD-64-598 SS2]
MAHAHQPKANVNSILRKSPSIQLFKRGLSAGDLIRSTTSNINSELPALSSMSISLLVSTICALLVRPAGAFPVIVPRNDADVVSNTLRNAWIHPSFIAVLLSIGGDVVAKSLAQLTGPIFVPIPFSFGWAAYSLIALMSVVGDGRLLPKPDNTAKVYNIGRGTSCANQSWMLGRFFRDAQKPLEGNSMIISIYGGGAALDWCYYSGFAVILIQLGIAAIPCGLYGDYYVLLVAGIATVLTLLTAALPQWRAEKFSGRRGSKQAIAITSGNGSPNVVVIINEGEPGSIDLEDLASGPSPLLNYGPPNKELLVLGSPARLRLTQIVCVALVLGWVAFLLTSQLVTHTWYLLFAAGLGTIFNVIVAGARRSPSTRMINVEHIQEIRQHKDANATMSAERVEEVRLREVMHTLMDAERGYPNLGKVLLPEFHGALLKPEEKKWWDGDRNAYDAARKKVSSRGLTPRLITRVKRACTDDEIVTTLYFSYVLCIAVYYPRVLEFPT